MSIEKAAQESEDKKGLCLVLMPYSDQMMDYYHEVIEPAISDSGLDPKLAKDVFRSSSIIDDIWTLIQDSKVLVALMTDRNPNVFYELGLAHASGKPVVLITENYEDIPFDLRPLRVIRYDKNGPAWGAQLREDIRQYIETTVSDPNPAIPRFVFRREPPRLPEDDPLVLDVRNLKAVVEAQARTLAEITNAVVSIHKESRTRWV